MYEVVSAPGGPRFLGFLLRRDWKGVVEGEEASSDSGRGCALHLLSLSAMVLAEPKLYIHLLS